MLSVAGRSGAVHEPPLQQVGKWYELWKVNNGPGFDERVNERSGYMGYIETSRCGDYEGVDLPNTRPVPAEAM